MDSTSSPSSLPENRVITSAVQLIPEIVIAGVFVGAGIGSLVKWLIYPSELVIYLFLVSGLALGLFISLIIALKHMNFLQRELDFTRAMSQVVDEVIAASF